MGEKPSFPAGLMLFLEMQRSLSRPSVIKYSLSTKAENRICHLRSRALDPGEAGRCGAEETEQMKHDEKKQEREGIPWWLAKLDLVRAELRGARFPRTAEEGIRECAELSEASMRVLKEQVGRSLGTRNEETVDLEIRRLMVRFSSMDKRWKAGWRKERAAAKGQ